MICCLEISPVALKYMLTGEVQGVGLKVGVGEGVGVKVGQIGQSVGVNVGVPGGGGGVDGLESVGVGVGACGPVEELFPEQLYMNVPVVSAKHNISIFFILILLTCYRPIDVDVLLP